MMVSGGALAYRPELSGSLETGNKLYTDVEDEDYNEEIDDRYSYRRCWLKYKQNLAYLEYYYVKLEYNQKEYLHKDNYDNITTSLWGNYTYKINDRLRNRWETNIKDKNYNYPSSGYKSYRTYRIKYQLFYDYSEKSDWDMYFQKQWNDYLYREGNDSTIDKLNVGWDYDVNEKLDVGTTFHLERQLYDYLSESTNKYESKVAVDFKYKL